MEPAGRRAGRGSRRRSPRQEEQRGPGAAGEVRLWVWGKRGWTLDPAVPSACFLVLPWGWGGGADVSLDPQVLVMPLAGGTQPSVRWGGAGGPVPALGCRRGTPKLPLGLREAAEWSLLIRRSALASVHLPIPSEGVRWSWHRGWGRLLCISETCGILGTETPFSVFLHPVVPFCYKSLSAPGREAFWERWPLSLPARSPMLRSRDGDV